MRHPRLKFSKSRLACLAAAIFVMSFSNLQTASAALPYFTLNHTYQNGILEDDNSFLKINSSNTSFEINVTDTDGNLANATFEFNGVNYTNYVSSQNLTSWITFNDFFGTNAIDKTGSGHNGTLGVGAAWHTGANCTFGSCVMMDGNGGSGNFVNVENTQNSQINASFTLITWLKLGTNNAAQDRIVDNEDAGPADGFALRYSNDMNLLFDVKKGSSSTAQIEPVGYNQTDVWKFWAMVFNNQSQTSSLYVDGVLVGTDASTQMSPSGNSLKYGRRSGQNQNQANMTIDDARLYFRALNQSEIFALYQIARGGGNLSQVYQITNGNTSSTFFINISTPSAGSYNFKWYATDFLGAQNSTQNLLLTIISTFLQSVCYTKSTLSDFYACSYDSSEFSPSKTMALIYSGDLPSFVSICADSFSSSYRFNLTAVGPLTTFVPLTNGVCSDIGNKSRVIAGGLLPTSPFGDVVTSAIKRLQMRLQYENIKLEGDLRMGEGFHDVCFKKIRQDGQRIVINVTGC